MATKTCAKPLKRCAFRRRGGIAAALLVAQLAPAGAAWSQSLADTDDGSRWVLPNVVQLRVGPSSQDKSLKQLERGTHLWALFVNDEGWANVQLKNDDGWQGGWIRQQDLAKTEPERLPRTVEPEHRPQVPAAPRPAPRQSEVRADGPPKPTARHDAAVSSSDWLPGLVLVGLVVLIALAPRTLRRRRARYSAADVEFQNSGEAGLSRLLQHHFRSPDYHLMNHITIPIGDGTTQIDHILVSRFGVFVIETKDYKGWIFGQLDQRQWTQVLYKRKFRFQNPIIQNRRHVQAVADLLDFLPAHHISSIVVFVGEAELKTEVPLFVLHATDVVDFIRKQSIEVMTSDRLALCVGTLETTRLAITRETDLQHIANVKRWHRE